MSQSFKEILNLSDRETLLDLFAVSEKAVVVRKSQIGKQRKIRL